MALAGRLRGTLKGGVLAWPAAVLSRRQEQVWPAAARRRGDRLADFAGRAVIVTLFTMLVVTMVDDFSRTGRVTGLLLLVSESLVVILTVVRRSALSLDRSWRARAVTALSILGPLRVQPVAAGELLPGAATAALMMCGLSIVVAGKLSLGRSFGLMPANRGIVCSGVYRFVRHPIYAGYLVTHFAFLLAHATVWNTALLIVADAALLARAVVEERTLAMDAAYVGYQQRVRWRVLPGVF